MSGPQVSTTASRGSSAIRWKPWAGWAWDSLGALCVIYTLMAIPFRSYIQPLIVMTAVPFGIVGAIWGHGIMGLPLSMLSMCGIVALTGIVVNDSLVLVTYVNGLRDQGRSMIEAVREGASARFRAIILTSLTTAAGVMPLMLEKEVQAQFLIPMAVALVFRRAFLDGHYARACTVFLLDIGRLSSAIPVVVAGCNGATRHGIAKRGRRGAAVRTCRRRIRYSVGTGAARPNRGARGRGPRKSGI